MSSHKRNFSGGVFNLFRSKSRSKEKRALKKYVTGPSTVPMEVNPAFEKKTMQRTSNPLYEPSGLNIVNYEIPMTHNPLYEYVPLSNQTPNELDTSKKVYAQVNKARTPKLKLNNIPPTNRRETNTNTVVKGLVNHYTKLSPPLLPPRQTTNFRKENPYNSVQDLIRRFEGLKPSKPSKAKNMKPNKIYARTSPEYDEIDQYGICIDSLRKFVEENKQQLQLGGTKKKNHKYKSRSRKHRK